MTSNPSDNHLTPRSSPPDTEREAPAYELKFLVDAALATQVQAWAANTLQLGADLHADSTGAYSTSSLYLDTPELDVFHRSPSYRRRKFRIRRYAADSAVFVERKTKKGDRVSKRRTSIGEYELASLAHPISLETWHAHWFHRRIALKRLQPACCVAYRRTALVGACAEGPLRLTLDRDLRGVLWGEWRFGSIDHALPLLTERVILELKFLRALPLPFKRLVDEFHLAPVPVSKYRLCREACGSVTATAGAPPRSTSEAARA